MKKTGKSLVEPEHKATALAAEEKAKKLNVNFQLPTDVMIATPVRCRRTNSSKGQAGL